MKKFTFLFLFLLFAGTHALLAQRTVSGIVTNAEDNEGIPGVQVQAKGTILGATTNMMGQYTITIPEDITALIFTFMGMTPQEIEIGSQTTIDVVMQSDATAIEGVEIVSYGTARRLGTSVGSVSQVSSAQLQGRASANVLDALQGQVAGLQVFSNSGNPNETQTLRLHGLGSLSTTTSSAPLYVVDGIQIEASTVLAMNPNDFESVTVLKDASATSIYGSRAANGVIVITTKRGSRNTDARITLRSQYGFSSMADKSYFDQLMTSDELLSFRENLAIGVWTPEKIADIRNKYGTETSTDWIDVYMRGNAPIFQNDLSIAGGGGKTTYFLSAGQYSQEGTAYGSSFDRYTVRANIESQAKDWLKVGVNTLISRSERSNNADSDWAGLIKINQLPWYSPMDENGNRYDIIPTDGGTRLPHPAYATENKKSLSTVSTLTGSFFVEITPLKGLKFISRSGTNAYLSESDSYTLPSYAEAMSLTTGGVRSIGSGTYITMTTNNVVEYSFELAKKHKITALVGQEGILSNSASEALAVQGLTEDRTMTINGNNNGTLVPGSINSGQSSSASLSFFGRLDYSFDNRFYADFSLRNDASSRFGAKNRNAQFWSIGGMWNMTNEKFIKSTGFITDAKLKVSYGTQGNSGIGDYTRLALVQSTYAYEDELAWTLSTNPGNDLLTWENQKKFTAGFRAELLKKYRIEFDFYNRTTTDMLMRMTMPLITGFPAVTANVGSLQNRGIDLSLGLDIIRTKDFYVSANVVFNYNVDKVLELYDDLPELRMSASSLEHYVVGQPVMLYYAQYGGVNPETGRQWWYRPGQDRFVTQQNRDSITEVLNDANLRQNSGYRRFSPITGGFGIQVGWKGLSLVADFAFVQGKYMWDATWAQLHSANAMAANAGTVNFSRDVLDYWKQAGDVTEFPDWTQSDQTIGAYADSRSVSNASFMRLKNLALSYSFDKKLLNKTKVFNNARIFVSARNLWTITAYKGIDPEVDNASELNTYMNSKQFQFGIELGF